MSTENDDDTEDHSQVSGAPLIFVSHDSRDAGLAEAFSKLINNVSMGMLRTFRSSDRSGTQGLEYGTEWYPELIKKVMSACDVICLLTIRSLDRPWVLYEAGVARGKLDIPVHGLALGIPLQKASTGPFSQFQNCGDDVESMTGLVLQLIRHLPNADPDSETVRGQVEVFKTRVDEILQEVASDDDNIDDELQPSSAKLFEEIKVMFKDLPSRVEASIDESGRAPSRHLRRFHPMEIEELMHFLRREQQGKELGFLVIASYFREDIPWFYELGVEAYRDARGRSRERARNSARQFVHAAELISHGPLSRSFRPYGKEMDMFMRELPMFIDMFGIGERNAEPELQTSEDETS